MSAGSLHTEVYNPQKDGIFPVTSTLVYSQTEAILLDAQFSTKDGEKLVQLIQSLGKHLKLIIITCGDPDFYFGLEPIVKAFPNVKIYASPLIIDHINKTKDYKLTFWGPQLGDGAPNELFVPEVTPETQFTIEGKWLGVRSRDDYAAYVWIPSIKTILGGVGVSWGVHVFSADTETPEKRASWRQVLQEMINLKPERVIPGHYLGEAPSGDEAIKFTLGYLETFEKVLEKNGYQNSAAVIGDMKEAYPNLGMEMSLELSAKVITGEMKF
ncbi:uncharacterized protein LOC135845621 isoform X2 [Planococcus citri]|uniref:uncharacterized protein LOC135845621 isoform X2 n=1 Tax=Planococcus citri TaxID=170843 RepID=UPI0031F84F41